jgi:hypothetical protein
MSSGGGNIIINHAKTALENPLVHGHLPEPMVKNLDPILARDGSTWTARDKKDVAAAFTWALTQIP